MNVTAQLKLLFLFVIYFFYAELVQAQTVQGKIYEMGTKNAISSAEISIISKAEHVYTDTNGNFQIKAAINDLLVIAAKGYRSDTILLTNLKFKQIYLLQIERWLAGVKINANKAVSTKTFQYQDPDFHNQTVKKQMDDDGNYKGGLSLRLWYWKKDEKRKKKIEKLINDEETAINIDRVFCKDTVQKYIPVGDEEINSFIKRYKPSLAVFQANSFNLLLYLNSAYKNFKTLSKDERIRSELF
ncbi:hypothetical protein GCM10023149_45120 [Mucilaginibacter gynuensis]|uniref:Carboxypeptidase-like protein n=1 Tax=Mucilaginibacter gynuensis TaxID=1302236 RepID=A0ABP8HAC2_9SPHI